MGEIANEWIMSDPFLINERIIESSQNYWFRDNNTLNTNDVVPKTAK